MILLSTGTVAMILWIVLPELSGRVRVPLLAWAAITATVTLLDERPNRSTYAEPAYQAGYIAGFDAAMRGDTGLAHASQHGRST